eukprot:5975085-Pleurochrysis_carterae.AAC.4
MPQLAGCAGGDGVARRGVLRGPCAFGAPSSCPCCPPPLACSVSTLRAAAAAADITSTIRLAEAAHPSGGRPAQARTTPAARSRSARQSPTAVSTAVSDAVVSDDAHVPAGRFGEGRAQLAPCRVFTKKYMHDEAS